MRAFLISCVVGLGRAECSSEAPRTFSKKQRVKLCTPSAPGAARCARLSLKKKIGTNDVIVDLCARASSEAPAECASILKKHFQWCSLASSETIACMEAAAGAPQNALEALCARASSAGPGTCFASATKTLKWAVDDTVALCQDAVDGGPVMCANKLKKRDAKTASALCSGVSLQAADGPANCLRKAPKGLDEVALCAGAEDDWPANCARGASEKDAERLCRKSEREMRRSTSSNELREECTTDFEKDANMFCISKAPYSWSNDAKFLLCSGQNAGGVAIPRRECGSMAAVAVGTSFPRSSLGNLNIDEAAAKTCRYAVDSTPAECLKAAPRAWDVVDAIALCARSTGKSIDTSAARCAKSLILRQKLLPPAAAAAICSGASNAEVANAAADCALASSGSIALCSAENKTVQEVRAATTCLAATSPTDLLATRIELCVGAKEISPTAPAACFKALRSSLKGDGVTLCAGATSPTPAYCAEASRPSLNATRCRAAVSIPTKLRVKRLDYDGFLAGEALLPHQHFSAVIGVLDQFDRIMSWPTYSEVRVVASIELRDSNGAILEGPKSNVSNEGFVHFDSLRLSEPGNYTVRFAFSQDRNNERVASAFVRISERDQGFKSPAGKCGAVLVSMLSCCGSVWSEKRTTEDTIAATAVVESFLPASALSIDGPLSGCETRLEQAGFQLFYGSWSATLVRYRQGLAWIEMEFHPRLFENRLRVLVPTEKMPHLERLGLDENATSKQIRRAYYRLSLQWHPDRWVVYPAYRKEVQRVFELVSDAYRQLQAAAAE